MKREDVDCVTNACDAGREGELIFRLVYEKAGCKKPIKRLWISFMQAESNLKVIQSVMGHRNIETTMDIYAEAAEERKQERFDGLALKLDNLFQEVEQQLHLTTKNGKDYKLTTKWSVLTGKNRKRNSMKNMLDGT